MKEQDKMKKLMIAAAIVCAAAFAQASSFQWNGASAFVVTPGAAAPTAGITGMAYLFATTGDEAFSQSSLLEAVRGGKSVADVAASNGVGADAMAVTAGKTGSMSDEFTYNSGVQTFYAVFVDSAASDRIYISSTVNATGTDLAAATTVALANQFAASKGAVSDGAYSAAGWYQTVPEPTSGLLLLLGIAGLALRRRRA